MWDIDGIVMALDELADSEDGMYVIAYARDVGDGKRQTAVGAHGNHLQLVVLIGELLEKIEEHHNT